MNNINLLYAYHAGANCKYFETMLKTLNNSLFNYRIVRPSEYEKINLDNYNVLVYQTFPDCHNLKKFHEESVIKLDNTIFHKFKGLKILLDSFDMGDYNGYERFGNQYPRIKHCPSYRYLKDFNVISTLITTGWSHKKFKLIPEEIKRDILVHCAFTVGVYPHDEREQIIQILKNEFSNITSFKRIPMPQYDEFLKRVQISIVTTGFGETSGSAYPSLQSGALLFVHERIRDVKLFPFVDLIDGKDYVSFNLGNFYEKLDDILYHTNERNKIRFSGQKKFFKGFDPERSAQDFFKHIKGIINV